MLTLQADLHCQSPQGDLHIYDWDGEGLRLEFSRLEAFHFFLQTLRATGSAFSLRRMLQARKALHRAGLGLLIKIDGRQVYADHPERGRSGAYFFLIWQYLRVRFGWV
jgi:hypothetical protein